MPKGLIQGYILVTRPEPQNTVLCKAITELGGKPIAFPTILFVPPTNPYPYHAAIAALGEQDWLIFNSPQAVVASVVDIRRAWPHFSPDVRLAAVGAGTAKALAEAGYAIDSMPTEWNSEGVLALPVFQAVAGKKIAIIRGKDGRGLLDSAFLERGAIVLPVVAYERVMPPAPNNDMLLLLKQQLISAIICTSFDGVKHLKIVLGESMWPYLKTSPLIVVSDRIKMLAQDLGFQTIWVAENASNDAILAVLARNESC